MTEDQNLRHQTVSRIARVVGQLIWLGNKRSNQQLSAHGLTAPQYFTLVSLSHQDQASPMHVLADITHQDAATVTGIVDRLVRLGYVSRERGQDDRRKVYVTLEESGRKVVEKVRQANLESWQHSFSALSQDDLTEMLRMVEKIWHAWQSMEPADQPTHQSIK